MKDIKEQKLSQTTKDNTKLFSLDGKTVRAHIVDVYDGTFDACFYLQSEIIRMNADAKDTIHQKCVHL